MEKYANNPIAMESLQHNLRRAKWIDDDVIELGLVNHPELGLEKAEIVVALCSMIYGSLAKANPHTFPR